MLKNSSKRLKIHSKTAQHRDRTRFEILEFQEEQIGEAIMQKQIHDWS